MASLSRERLVQLIAALLAKKGDSMALELDCRVAAGESLDVKGIKVDTSIIDEALKQYRSANKAAVANSPVKPAPSLPSSPLKEDVRQSPLKSSPRWSVPVSSSSTSRWNPGAASASLLAAKAQTECEHAEVFSRSVRVLTGFGPIAVFKVPDVLSKPLDSSLQDNLSVDVVARFLSPRDGRVYLRLKAETGWVTTRSLHDLQVVVLESIDEGSAIEPEKFRQPLKSVAVEILPTVDQDAANNADNVGGNVTDEEDMDDFSEGSCEEDDNEDMETAADEKVQTASVPDDPDLAPSEEVDSNGEMVDELVSKQPSSHLRKTGRKFKVIAGGCPILSKPSSAELALQGNQLLKKGQEFWADGVYFEAAEQRAYLHLTRGRGWVCERSRLDIHRFAVAKCSTRQGPVSKKMAKAVIFRGGDAGGQCRLKKDDLVKNSQGKIVSRRASEAAKKRFNDGVGKWTAAVHKAREELGVTGFQVVKKGTPLYERAQEIYIKSKGL